MLLKSIPIFLEICYNRPRTIGVSDLLLGVCRNCCFWRRLAGLYYFTAEPANCGKAKGMFRYFHRI